MANRNTLRVRDGSRPEDDARAIRIEKAGVLGAGTMGARIAAHLCNAGLGSVMLLDLAPPPGTSGDIADKAVEMLLKAKPPAFFEPALAARIQTGNFDDDLPLLAECDWVIEAVTEDLPIKQALLRKAVPHLKPGAIVTTNTSGLSVEAIASVLPEGVQRRWFGAHFFNPPRYMRLVEIIPTLKTEQAAIDAVSHFADISLGKDVVPARDTPNFIANRIGVFAMLEAMRLMQEEDLTVEEVDALTGPAIGWPRSATFRLADLIGLDVFAHVVGNFPPAEKRVVPDFVRAMIERRWLGDKTRQGFYKRDRDAQGNEVRLALNWKTLEYHPAAKPQLAALDRAMTAEKLEDRIRLLLSPSAQTERGARFHWRLLTGLWNYAAETLNEIADNASLVDRAMRAGFNWEKGPFELWDAASVPETVMRMRAAGERVSAQAERLLNAGADSWYLNWGTQVFLPEHAVYRSIRRPNGIARVSDYAMGDYGRESGSARLVDLGDAIACIELTSRGALLDAASIAFFTRVLSPGSEETRRFKAFVITGDGENFCAGWDLAPILAWAQAGAWNEIDSLLRSLQRMTELIQYGPSPVVAGPFGLCLGVGAEMALRAAGRQAFAELAMGLDQTAVGLLPAAGGCKEMVLRALDSDAGQEDDRSGDLSYRDGALRAAFEAIVLAKVSGSALEAKRLGFLSLSDWVTMNRDRLVENAKAVAIRVTLTTRPHARLLDEETLNHTPPARGKDIAAPGRRALGALETEIERMGRAGALAGHDITVARQLARVLCGGNAPTGAPVSEQHFLDLEREAFLSLCGDPKTIDRIAYKLKTGKRLKN